MSEDDDIMWNGIFDEENYYTRKEDPKLDAAIKEAEEIIREAMQDDGA